MMMINEHLVVLYNTLLINWKMYEETEYQDCSITGDKIVIDTSEEYFELIDYIRNTVTYIRSELEDIWLIADGHFNSVTKIHIYTPLCEVYKHPIKRRMTLKQIEHLIKTLNNLLSAIYTFKANIDLHTTLNMLVNKSKGYKILAHTDIGDMVLKKHFVPFGNGGFGPVALPTSSSFSPNTEALIDNVKETLENIQYRIRKPEESEEEKNYKGNKDKIKHKEHFYKYLNRQGMSIKK